MKKEQNCSEENKNIIKIDMIYNEKTGMLSPSDDPKTSAIIRKHGLLIEDRKAYAPKDEVLILDLSKVYRV